MSESIRYESAERVRDFYRNQGAAKEQQRIIELLENIRSTLGLEYQGVDLQELWELMRPWLITQIKGESNV